MSLELAIQNLTAEIIQLRQIMQGTHVQVPQTAAAPQPATVPTPVPTPEPEPAPAPQPAAVPEVPTPAFASAPQPAPAAGPLPFADGKGVMAYCMEKYRTLGPVKGGMIQQVLTELGHTNLTGLRPDQYAVFFEKVEAIK